MDARRRGSHQRSFNAPPPIDRKRGAVGLVGELVLPPKTSPLPARQARFLAQFCQNKPGELSGAESRVLVALEARLPLASWAADDRRDHRDHPDHPATD